MLTDSKTHLILKKTKVFVQKHFSTCVWCVNIVWWLGLL